MWMLRLKCRWQYWINVGSKGKFVPWYLCTLRYLFIRTTVKVTQWSLTHQKSHLHNYQRYINEWIYIWQGLICCWGKLTNADVGTRNTQPSYGIPAGDKIHQIASWYSRFTAWLNDAGLSSSWILCDYTSMQWKHKFSTLLATSWGAHLISKN